MKIERLLKLPFRFVVICCLVLTFPIYCLIIWILSKKTLKQSINYTYTEFSDMLRDMFKRG